MYNLQLRAMVQKGGAHDLGGGETPCVACAYCAGHDSGKSLKGDASQRAGYECARFLLVDSGELSRCIDARLDAEACGADGAGFEPIARAEVRSMIDAVAGSAHCNDCAHQLRTTFRNGASLASPWNLKLCARYVLPVSGDPMDCQSARGDSTICGLEGKGFAPKPSEESIDASGEAEFGGDDLSLFF